MGVLQVLVGGFGATKTSQQGDRGTRGNRNGSGNGNNRPPTATLAKGKTMAMHKFQEQQPKQGNFWPKDEEHQSEPEKNSLGAAPTKHT